MKPIGIRCCLPTLGSLLVTVAIFGGAGCASNQQHLSPQASDKFFGDPPRTAANAAPRIPEPEQDPPDPQETIKGPEQDPPDPQETIKGPEQNPPDHQEVIKDPLEPINEKSFNMNQGLDQHAFRPVVNVWVKAVPSPARKCISRFFENAGVVPRFTNAVFQMRFKWAGTELARFGINSTIGIAGLFDPADKWFGLKGHDNNFAMTLARYGIGQGWYLMPPVGKPFDGRKAIGSAVDSLMNPMNYLLPGSGIIYTRLAHGIEALNSRAESETVINDLHRFSIDEYGAVQDAYVQEQKHKEAAMRNPQ